MTTTSPATHPSAPAPGPPAPTGPEILGRVASAVAPLLGQLGRGDLSERVRVAAARVARPATIVCVVGEFKQGKSSLVNGLLASPVCPIDDDLATSVITMVRYNDHPVAAVRRRVDGRSVVEEIAFEKVPTWATEAENPGNTAGVERVEVGVASALLKDGLAIVDTPGMGGLATGHAAATLAFLPFADGLLFVSDATSELTRPEVEFLQAATERCPTVLMVQTKTDLAPHWRRIVERNTEHLATAGMAVSIVPVSSTLRAAAIERRDADLNQRSGFTELIRALGVSVVMPAKASALARSVSDVSAAVAQARSALQTEKDLIDDPARAQEGLAALKEVNGRLEHLRGPGAKWRTVLADRVSDLTAEANHRFRGGMRGVTREVEGAVEELSTAKGWEDLSAYMQAKVAEEVSSVFLGVERGRQALTEEILAILADENLQLPNARGDPAVIDVATLWSSKPLEEPAAGPGAALRQSLNTVRGSSGGMSLIGMLGHYLPAASLAFLASNPVLLSVGAAFGALHLYDERKRRLAARRQVARTQVRQFVDDVQFEVGDRLSQLMRDLQRDLRDDVGDRLSELQRSYTETARSAQRALEAGAAHTKVRSAELGKLLDHLRSVDDAIATVGR